MNYIRARLSIHREKEETNRKRIAAALGRLLMIHDTEIKQLKTIQNQQREAVLKQLQEVSIFSVSKLIFSTA